MTFIATLSIIAKYEKKYPSLSDCLNDLWFREYFAGFKTNANFYIGWGRTRWAKDLTANKKKVNKLQRSYF